MKKLIVASNNQGKVKEIKALLEGLYRVVSLADEKISLEVEETGKTFEENSLLKAEAVYRLTGCASIADDSGLEVEGLDGAPGVYSARYAGPGRSDEENNNLLLKNLQNQPNRRARFVCAVTLYISPEEIITARGVTEGEISYRPDGGEGFGYDPLFYSYDLKKSFGRATMEEKNVVSHRARALKALTDKLKK